MGKCKGKVVEGESVRWLHFVHVRVCECTRIYMYMYMYMYVCR